MSRPKLDIDPNVVAAMAFAGSPTVEIAGYLGCDEGTIRKRFSEILTKERAGRKHKLRQLQWAAATKGNVTMLIWLGKQELEQNDSGARPMTMAEIDSCTLEELEQISKGVLPKRFKDL